MNTKYSVAFVVVLTIVSMTGRLFADQAEDEAAIRASIKSYVAAFNQGDAKSIAAKWSPGAVYTNPMTGEEVVGREAIEKQLVQIFSDAQGLKIEVDVNSIQFVSPNVAIEEGTARVLRDQGEPEETVYSCVYVRNGNDWLVDRMTEQPKLVARSNYQHLKDLEWMIGTFVDQDGEATIETTCQWTKNQNFISRKFSVSIAGEQDLAGVQMIGWDPIAQRIRSWVFDSDGGFGGSTWTKKGNKWIVNSKATLADGRLASGVRTMTVVDDQTIHWELTGRSLDGEILPSIGPIKLTRNQDSE